MAVSGISNMLNNKLRFNGMASGLDTDSIVQQLMRADRAKLDKITQDKQVLEWKRDDYRSIISSLSSFRDAYMDVAKPKSNFRSSTAFSSYNVSYATEAAKKVANITTGSAAKPGDYKLNVTQIAKGATITSAASVSGALSANVAITDFDLQGKQISVTLDNSTKTIDLENYVGGDDAAKLADLETKLETAFIHAFGTVGGQSKINVDVSSGKVSLSLNPSMSSSTLSVNEAPNNFLSTVGFTDGKKNFVSGNDVDDAAYTGGTFKISIDGGAAQTITLGNTDDIDDLTDQINNAIMLNGQLNGKVSASNDGSTLSFTAIAGNSISLSSGDADNILGELGFSSGANASGTATNALNLSSDETNKTFILNIDGVDKTIKIDANYADIDSLIAYLNNPATKFDDDPANSLSSLGVVAGKDSGGTKLVFKSAKEVIFKKAGSDGLDSLGFTSSGAQSNRTSLTSSLYSLRSTFSAPLAGGADFDKTENVQFTINDVQINLGKDYDHATLNDVMSAVNASRAGVTMSYSSSTDKFTITTKATGSEQDINYTDTPHGLLASLGISGAAEAGKDAVFELNDVEMVRSSNDFKHEGITYKLKETGTAEFSISADSDSLFDKIKGFVDKYNEVIGNINAQLSEKRYRDYTPLTDEQKEVMKDSDIEKWEEKAKSGLLRDDSILSNAVSNLRRALYDSIYTTSGDKSSKLSYSLSSIGITTGAWSEKGKLIIDEEKLKTAIKEKPDEVSNLFSRESSVSYTEAMNNPSLAKKRYNESGLANRLYDVIQDNVRTTRNSNNKKGLLIETAGIQGDTSEFVNIINKSIEASDSRYNSYLDILVNKENAYYAKFTRLERVLSQMNSQSSWIGSQLGR